MCKMILFILLLITVHEITTKPLHNEHFKEGDKRSRRQTDYLPLLQISDQNIPTTQNNIATDSVLKIAEIEDHIIVDNNNSDPLDTEIQKAQITEIATNNYKILQSVVNPDNWFDVEISKYGSPIVKKEYQTLCDHALGCNSPTVINYGFDGLRKRRNSQETKDLIETKNRDDNMAIDTTERRKRGFINKFNPISYIPPIEKPKLELPFGLSKEREITKDIPGISGNHLQFNFGIRDQNSEKKEHEGIRLVNPFTKKEVSFDIKWLKDSKGKELSSRGTNLPTDHNIHSSIETEHASSVIRKQTDVRSTEHPVKVEQQWNSKPELGTEKSVHTVKQVEYGQAQTDAPNTTITPVLSESQNPEQEFISFSKSHGTKATDQWQQQFQIDFGQSQLKENKLKIPSKIESLVLSGQEQSTIEFDIPTKFQDIADSSAKGNQAGQQQTQVEFGQSQLKESKFETPSKIKSPVSSGQEQSIIELGIPSKLQDIADSSAKDIQAGQQQSQIEFGESHQKVSGIQLPGGQTKVPVDSSSLPKVQEADIHVGQQQSLIEFGQSQLKESKFETPSKIKSPVSSGQEQSTIEFGIPSKLQDIADSSAKSIEPGQHQSPVDFNQSEFIKEVKEETTHSFISSPGVESTNKLGTTKDYQYKIAQKKADEIIKKFVTEASIETNTDDLISHSPLTDKFIVTSLPQLFTSSNTNAGHVTDRTQKTTHENNVDLEISNESTISVSTPKNDSSLYTVSTISYLATDHVPLWKLFTKGNKDSDSSTHFRSQTKMTTEVSSTEITQGQSQTTAIVPSHDGTPGSIVKEVTETQQSKTGFIKSQVEFINTSKIKDIEPFTSLNLEQNTGRPLPSSVSPYVSIINDYTDSVRKYTTPLFEYDDPISAKGKKGHKHKKGY